MSARHFLASDSANRQAGILRPMRRWFVILLLALLPFQFTWAAVASYCAHETGSQAQHVGHHEHEHTSVAADLVADADALSADAPAGQHLDCGHCHGGCTGMPMLKNAAVVLTSAQHPAATFSPLVLSRAQAPPERPQWLTLA
jgi:hypothetical protein